MLLHMKSGAFLVRECRVALRSASHPYITAIQFGFLTPSSTGGEVGELVCSTHWLKYGGVAVTVAVTGRHGDIISQGIGAAWNRDQCMSVLRMDWEMSVIKEGLGRAAWNEIGESCKAALTPPIPFHSISPSLSLVDSSLVRIIGVDSCDGEGRTCDEEPQQCR